MLLLMFSVTCMLVCDEVEIFITLLVVLKLIANFAYVEFGKAAAVVEDGADDNDVITATPVVAG